jgi:hypothetical protein
VPSPPSRSTKVDRGDGRGLVDDERFVALDAFTTLVALQDRVQFVIDEKANVVPMPRLEFPR